MADNITLTQMTIMAMNNKTTRIYNKTSQPNLPSERANGGGQEATLARTKNRTSERFYLTIAKENHANGTDTLDTNSQ